MTMFRGINSGIQPVSAITFVRVRTMGQKITRRLHISAQNGKIQRVTFVRIEIDAVFPEHVQQRDQPVLISVRIVDEMFLHEFRRDFYRFIKQPVETLVRESKASGRPFRWHKIAVMGCPVNGPGEARDAEIGLAGSRNGSLVLFRKGEVVGAYPEAEGFAAFAAMLTGDGES